MCNFQKHPALGVTSKPEFTWIVPACAGASDQQQSAYQIKVADAVTGKALWDSGKVASSNSIGEPYSGPSLAPGSAYNWTVSTWSAACQSTPSDNAMFITSLYSNGWAPKASFIWPGSKEVPDSPHAQSNAMFAFFRKVAEVPAGKIVAHASAFITAVTDDVILCGYKLYINGVLINVGPGRGEAKIWNGDGQYNAYPYTTLDVTPYLPQSGQFLIAVQSVGCTACKGRDLTKGLLLQLNMQLADGMVVTTATDATWDAFDADPYINPRQSITH